MNKTITKIVAIGLLLIMVGSSVAAILVNFL